MSSKKPEEDTKDAKDEPQPGTSRSGIQSEEDSTLQEVERSTLMGSLKAGQCVFYNELLEMEPEAAAAIFRSPTAFIAGPAEDYGIQAVSDKRDKKQMLLRPLQAIYKESFRLVCLKAGVPPLSVMMTTYKELFFVVTASSQRQISQLRVPYHMEVWSDDLKVQAEALIEALSQVALKVAQIAVRRAALATTPKEVKKAMMSIGDGLPLKEAPLLLQKFMTLAEEDPDAAMDLLEAAAFPDAKTLREAYEGIIPSNERPVAFYPMLPKTSRITAINCPRAQLLLQRKHVINSQSNEAMATDVAEACKCDFCSLNMLRFLLSDYYNLQDQEGIFLHYPLKQAKVDRTLRSGKLECTNKPAREEDIFEYDKHTSDQDWEQIKEASGIIHTIWESSACTLTMTPWVSKKLYAYAPQADEPRNGFTTLSLATFSGKILVIRVNFPGQGYLPECELPEDVKRIINSPQIVKTSFGLVNDNRLKCLGLKPVNLVDLSNLVVMAFPQPELEPIEARNALHYYLHRSGSPVNVYQHRLPIPGKKPDKLPSYPCLSIHPDMDDFSGRYADWKESLKIYLKVTLRGSLSIMVALAAKSAIQAHFDDNANVLPLIHFVCCLVEGQVRYGSQPRPSNMNRTPYGSGTVKTIKMEEPNVTAFRRDAPVPYVNAGHVVMTGLDAYEKIFAMDPGALDAEFALKLTDIVGPLDQLNSEAILRMLFKKNNCVFHPCPHCGATDHSTPTEQCLELQQYCIYPQCLQHGHNIKLCPEVINRCSECGKLGHRPRHHHKPAYQLLMEFLYACHVHFLAYRITNRVKIGLQPNGKTPEGQDKFHLVLLHTDGLNLAELPRKANILN